MKWQDSIKVIITQKLHQIRNWKLYNMLYGMSTIEIIENLKIENLTENRVILWQNWLWSHTPQTSGGPTPPKTMEHSSHPLCISVEQIRGMECVG